MSSNIRIFGAGKWGLAVAYHLSNQKNKVQVFDIEKDRVDALNKLKYCKDLDVKFNEYIEFHYFVWDSITWFEISMESQYLE